MEKLINHQPAVVLFVVQREGSLQMPKTGPLSLCLCALTPVCVSVFRFNPFFITDDLTADGAV